MEHICHFNNRKNGTDPDFLLQGVCSNICFVFIHWFNIECDVCSGKRKNTARIIFKKRTKMGTKTPLSRQSLFDNVTLSFGQLSIQTPPLLQPPPKHHIFPNCFIYIQSSVDPKQTELWYKSSPSLTPPTSPPVSVPPPSLPPPPLKAAKRQLHIKCFPLHHWQWCIKDCINQSLSDRGAGGRRGCKCPGVLTSIMCV